MRGWLAVALMVALGLAPGWAQLDTQWVRLYGGDHIDLIYDHIQTADGGFAFTGHTMSDDQRALWLSKIDTEGQLVWDQRYEFDMDVAHNYGVRGYSLFEQKDGDFLVFGYIRMNDEDRRKDKIFGLRTNSEGDSVIWTRMFGGDGWESAFKAIRTEDGGYALAGVTTSWGAGQEDFFLLKLDENCDSLWMRTYGDRGVDECNDLIQSSDGGYVLVGSTTMIRNAPSAYWVLFVDENGDSLRSYVASYNEQTRSVGRTIQEVDNGNFIISGEVYNSHPEFPNHSRIWTFDLDSDARRRWARLDGSDNIHSDICGYASCLLSDTSLAITGGYYLSGEFGSPYGKLWVLEVTASGDGRYILDEGWEELSCGYSIIVTSANELSVAGYAGRENPPTWYDGLVYKTSELTNSVPHKLDDIDKYTISVTAWPNPFNALIRIAIPPSIVTRVNAITVYDNIGRPVKSFNAVELISSGGIKWQPEGLPNGCYFVNVKWGGGSFQKKVVLLR